MEGVIREKDSKSSAGGGFGTIRIDVCACTMRSDMGKELGS